MRYILFSILLVSCAHDKKNVPPEEELVSVTAALNQAQSSYLKGCVDALHEIKVPLAFPGCRDKAILHRQELESIMYQELPHENF